MSRIIQGLVTAQISQRPKAIPAVRRRKGAKKHGLRYEASLASAMPFAHHGQWFEFKDLNGFGFCQVDFLFRTLDKTFVLEAKLSDLEGARLQLRALYEPVVAMACKTECYGIAVVRHLSALNALQCDFMVFDSLYNAVHGTLNAPKKLAILHWRERTPIGLKGLVPQPPIPKFALHVAA